MPAVTWNRKYRYAAISLLINFARSCAAIVRSTPLDFDAVADHAEHMGVFNQMRNLHRVVLARDSRKLPDMAMSAFPSRATCP